MTKPHTIDIQKLSAQHADFKKLVLGLDKELAITDGDDHDYYKQFNHIDNLKYVLVGYVDGEAIACGALRRFNENTVEIKRMFTKHPHRGKGYAHQLLQTLEQWAEELGYYTCILETGIKQTSAIALYKKAGYKVIENYGPYEGLETSVCFSKEIHSGS